MKFTYKKTKNSAFIFILSLFFISSVSAQEEQTLIHLKGDWKFSIGDNKNWAKADFDDSGWDDIKVPSIWEKKGYYGYNGYAWYRKSFYLGEEKINAKLLLELGYIDDVDEVYLNGELIGSTGTFPPHYASAYNAHRKYFIPNKLLRTNTPNVIAVRVFDSYAEGGIVSGETRILEIVNPMPLAIDLQGTWNFNVGDNMAWKDEKLDLTDWFTMPVPGNWENHGFRDYDGFGWYRTTFDASNLDLSEELILLVGKIDDLDEVFINGIKVGNTGTIYDNPNKINRTDEWNRKRIYHLPAGLIYKNKPNTIAIRVYDGKWGGGIYEGPIGIISKSKYQQYVKSRK